MSEDKRKDGKESHSESDTADSDDRVKGNAASRARNRTVLLTPDITGQVRSLLNHEQRPVKDPLGELLPPLSGPGSNPSGSSGSGGGTKGIDFGGDLSTDSETRRKVAGESAPKPVGGKSSARTVFLQRDQLPPSYVVNPTQAGAGEAESRPTPSPFAAAPVAKPSPPAVNVPRPPASKIVGFLVSFDADANGDVYELRAGRWLLTSRPTDHGECIIVDDDTISPLHAILRVAKEGKVQVLDQLSEYGTGYTPAGSKTEKEISGSMATINHGDTVRFGKRHFILCLVPPHGVTKGEE